MSRLSLVSLACLLLTACFVFTSAADAPYSVSDSLPWNVSQSTTPILTTANGLNLDSMAAFSGAQWLFLSALKPRVIARYDVSLSREVRPINYTETGLAGGNTFGFDVLAMLPQQLVTSVRGGRIVLVAAYQSQTVVVSMDTSGQWLAAMAVSGFRSLDIDRSGVNVLAISSTVGLSVYTVDTLVAVSTVATSATSTQYYGVAFKPDGTVMVAVNGSSGVSGIQQYDSGLRPLLFRPASIRGFTGANFLVDQSDCMIWRGPRGEWHYLSLRDQSFVAVSAFNASALTMTEAGQLLVLAYNSSTGLSSLISFNRTQSTPPVTLSSSTAGSTPSNSNSADSSDHGAVVGLAVTVAALAVALAVLALALLRLRHRSNKLPLDGSAARTLSTPLASV